MSSKPSPEYAVSPTGSVDEDADGSHNGLMASPTNRARVPIPMPLHTVSSWSFGSSSLRRARGGDGMASASSTMYDHPALLEARHELLAQGVDVLPPMEDELHDQAVGEHKAALTRATSSASFSEALRAGQETELRRTAAALIESVAQMRIKLRDEAALRLAAEKREHDALAKLRRATDDGESLQATKRALELRVDVLQRENDLLRKEADVLSASSPMPSPSIRSLGSFSGAKKRRTADAPALPEFGGALLLWARTEAQDLLLTQYQWLLFGGPVQKEQTRLVRSFAEANQHVGELQKECARLNDAVARGTVDATLGTNIDLVVAAEDAQRRVILLEELRGCSALLRRKIGDDSETLRTEHRQLLMLQQQIQQHHEQQRKLQQQHRSCEPASGSVGIAYDTPAGNGPSLLAAERSVSPLPRCDSSASVPRRSSHRSVSPWYPSGVFGTNYHSRYQNGQLPQSSAASCVSASASVSGLGLRHDPAARAMRQQQQQQHEPQSRQQHGRTTRSARAATPPATTRHWGYREANQDTVATAASSATSALPHQHQHQPILTTTLRTTAVDPSHGQPSPRTVFVPTVHHDRQRQHHLQQRHQQQQQQQGLAQPVTPQVLRPVSRSAGVLSSPSPGNPNRQRSLTPTRVSPAASAITSRVGRSGSPRVGAERSASRSPSRRYVDEAMQRTLLSVRLLQEELRHWSDN